MTEAVSDVATEATTEASKFCYFGYGSLVNRGTLPAGTEAVRAVLVGFRRGWRCAAAAGASGYCSLSIEPCDGGRISGLLAGERVEALGRLDERERRYHRLMFPADRLDMADGQAAPAVFYTYRAMARYSRFGHASSPATLSYVDCVLQGYLREFGEAGVRDFIATTDGWDVVPFLDDRDAPRYQRAQPLTAAERALFDRLLAAAGVRRLGAGAGAEPARQGVGAEPALQAADAERLRQTEGRRQQVWPEARPRMQQRAENDADL